MFERAGIAWIMKDEIVFEIKGTLLLSLLALFVTISIFRNG
jgi:hypothetical protein